MSPRLKVSDFIVQRLKESEEDSFGYVLGISDDEFIYALGIVKQLNSIDKDDNNSDSCDLSNFDIIPNLPANINFCGVFSLLTKEKIEDSITDFNKNIEKPLVVIQFDFTSKELTSYLYEENILKTIEHTIVKQSDVLKSFLYLRLTATIPLSCDFQSESLEEAFKFIQLKISNGNSAFHIEDSDVYILGNNLNDVNGVQPEITLEKFSSSLKKNSDNKNDNDIQILKVNLYLRGTNNDKTPQLAPLIQYVKKIYKHARIQLCLDSLVIVPNHFKLMQLYPILVESAYRNLALHKQSLLSQLKSSDIRNVSLPETYHFFPKLCGHFISVVYPAKQTLEQLKEHRETLHLLFALPRDKPLFRRGNAFDFSQTNDKNPNSLILNPHEGLPNSGVVGGECFVVQGTYAYHHYMQDNCDDNGWGCAYRSLQTIFSWFRFQGYTNLPVPSHRVIQQCLVNIGDKPSSFVGSKQWIGSTEVNFVLDSMLGVTCRIVNVSSGEEMSMKGGELSYHFKTQGTPVMIGGGVLAHTILGVDYNKSTGDIKFLILDPHYTGGKDLKVIQSKGWCGWKGPEFWKKDAFYNMCLPLRPRCV